MRRPLRKTALASILFAGVVLAVAGIVEAQQPGKIFRIGFLDPSNASGSAVVVDVFRQELSKLGWIEGKNITIEYRFAELKPERVAELAAELVRLKVDLIVTSGVPPGIGSQESDYYHPHRNYELYGPRGVRLGCQSCPAGRQCHRVLNSSD
jgi:hypothetical protein